MSTPVCHKIKTLTWEEAQEYAGSRGGRLPTLEEVREWLGDRAYPGHEDSWVPVTREDGERDWVQIGNHPAHFPGKSHLETGGFPAWSDDKADCPYKYILFVPAGSEEGKESTAVPIVEVATTLTWNACLEYAQLMGGRLYTLEEVRELLGGKPFTGHGDGRDSWAPVTREDGSPDWVEIGNHPAHFPGKSHTEDTDSGFPAWSDSADEVTWRVVMYRPSGTGPKFGSILGDGKPVAIPASTLSWEAAAGYAAFLGGALPSLDQVREWLGEEPQCLCGHGGARDTWVPVTREGDGDKDWLQIGSHPAHFPGKSHLETGGWPAWNESKDVMPLRYLLVVPGAGPQPALNLLKLFHIPYLTYDDAQAYAEELGGRLPTFEEVQELVGGDEHVPLSGCGNALDAWVAVVRGDDKDWVQVGSHPAHFAGKSHSDTGGFPAWSDDRALCTWRFLLVLTK